MGTSCSSNDYKCHDIAMINSVYCIVSIFYEFRNTFIHDIVLEFKNDQYNFIQTQKTQCRTETDNISEKINKLFGTEYKLYETSALSNSPTIFVASIFRDQSHICSGSSNKQGNLIRISIDKLTSISDDTLNNKNDYVLLEDENHRLIKINKFVIRSIQMREIALNNNFNDFIAADILSKKNKPIHWWQLTTYQ